MKLRNILAVSVGFFALLPTVSFAGMQPCALLTRNLKLGDSGADVRTLQVLLNTFSETRIASVGAGSPGQESTYFGMKTKLAVVKFQELYHQEVLTPAGLSRGTGFVGAGTRAKIGALCGVIPVSPSTVKPISVQPITPPVSATLPIKKGTSSQETLVIPPFKQVQKLVIKKSTPTAPKTSTPSMDTLNGLTMIDDTVLEFHFPSSYVVNPGDTLTLNGSGFVAEGSTVHIGTTTISGVKPIMSGILRVTIPQSVTLGKTDIWITNSKGESNKRTIVIIVPGTLQPKITSISPIEGFLGQTITFKGTGFLKQGNEVLLSTGEIIEGLTAQDGATISFSLASLQLTAFQGGEDFPQPLWLRVVNSNGISNTVVFTVHF